MSEFVGTGIVAVVITSGLLAAIAILQRHRRLPVTITAGGLARAVAAVALLIFVLHPLPPAWTPVWPVVYVLCIRAFFWDGWMTSLQLALISSGVIGIVLIVLAVTWEILRALLPI
jgi:hypothetical protein